MTQTAPLTKTQKEFLLSMVMLAGLNAFEAGKTATPAQDPAVMKFIGGTHGIPATRILTAWSAGWNVGNLAAEVPGLDTSEFPGAKAAREVAANLKKLAA